LHSVRSSIEDVSAGDPIRGVLNAVLEETIARGTIDEVVCRSLLAYGRALDYEASWALAIDVFQTVSNLTRPEKNAKLAVEAHIAVGGAARRNGEWETSARAYSQAAYIADTMGDRQGVLTVQVGIANTYLAKGNVPQAQSILDDVLMQAHEQGYEDVEAVGLHSRAVVATRRGEFAEGLKLAHTALGLTKRAAERDAILEDIGGLFSELGMYDSARDAHLILAATAQSKLVRWSATVNLMELAGLEGQEKAFDDYARELAAEPLNPWVRAHFLLFLGEGFARLGRTEAAKEALQEAVRFAETNQIHQIVFKAESALASAGALAKNESQTKARSDWMSVEVGTVARAISDLRKTAVAAA
jgi:tetratricopeptide (TPR) repeat protein